MKSAGSGSLLRLLTALMGAGAAVLAYGSLIEPRWLDVAHVIIKPDPAVWQNIPPLKIAQISDLHVGGLAPLSVIRQAIQAVNAANPDLVVLTGDIIGGKGAKSLAATTKQALELLGGLRPELTRLAVLGNHDHQVARRISASAVRQTSAAAGWQTLNNSVLKFEHQRRPIWFIGVDDPVTYHDNFAYATRLLAPNDQPRILLCHWPDLVERISSRDAAVMFSGHTHGGHINLPGLLALALRDAKSSYRAGAYNKNGVRLYVNRGLGGSRLRMRIRARPEVAIITIQS